MNEYQMYDQPNNEEQESSKQSWYSDDFEQAVKNAVPKDQSISVYVPKKKRSRSFFKNPAVVAIISSLLTCSVCLGAFAFMFNKSTPKNLLPSPSNHTSNTSTVANNGEKGTITNAVNTAKGTLSIPEVYDKVSPAVVSILCSAQNGNYMQPQSTMSSGSGVIIRNDGYIVTNNHVIEGANTITVQTIAGLSFEAKLIGSDSRTDLAVLKVESDEALPYAEMGDSSEIRVGDMALAIGNPLREELAGTLTVGYISAVNRNMIIDDKQMTMLQTDAAINPGNSGGALLNMYGQLIGINTAKSTGYDVEGLGFAIPINDVKPIVESIMENGYVAGRPLVGIGGVTVTEAIAEANDLPIGVYVKQITAFGAAERAGIQTGDVIVEFDGQKVETIDDINEIKNSHAVGDTIRVKFVRAGKNMETELTLLEEKPQAEEEQQTTIEQQPQMPSQPQIPSDFFSWFGW